MIQKQQIVKMDISTPVKNYNLVGYKWNKRSNLEEAFFNHHLYLQSIVDGDPYKAEIHKEEVKDIFCFDLALNSVGLARKKGVNAKIFGTSSERKPVLKFKGKQFNWVLKDIGISSHPVPARFRNIVQEVNKAGVLFDDFYIGEPEIQQLPAPQARRKRDPVLVGRIGRWLVELGRWL